MPKIQIDTRDQQVGQDKPLDLTAEGVVERPDLDIAVVDGPTADEQAKELAFMEEKLEIMLAEATDPNAENPVQVAVNGVNQFFFRGQPQTVRRKFVEVLARAKQTDISTQVIQQSAGDEPINRINKRTALKYPFSVIRDESPRGATWLKKVLAEA